jgi:hypothetical protein
MQLCPDKKAEARWKRENTTTGHFGQCDKTELVTVVAELEHEVAK